ATFGQGLCRYSQRRRIEQPEHKIVEYGRVPLLQLEFQLAQAMRITAVDRTDLSLVERSCDHSGGTWVDVKKRSPHLRPEQRAKIAIGDRAQVWPGFGSKRIRSVGCDRIAALTGESDLRRRTKLCQHLYTVLASLLHCKA